MKLNKIINKNLELNQELYSLWLLIKFNTPPQAFDLTPSERACRSNDGRGSALVKMSAGWSADRMCRNSTGARGSSD